MSGHGVSSAALFVGVRVRSISIHGWVRTDVLSSTMAA
jgi:hypothetical protein